MTIGPRFFLFCTILLFSRALLAECVKQQDHRTNASTGIQIVDMTVSGTQAMSSSDLTSLVNKMIGGCFNDDSDEIEERVRALFQDHRYFRVEVQALHIATVDPLKNPKTVKIEAEVVEGERFRLKEIAFTGNHHLLARKLREAFPLKQKDLFERARIAGLQAVNKLYSSEGYLDAFMIPNVSFTASSVSLKIEVKEGSQYHMGKLDVFAKKEVSDRIRGAWDLAEGKVYDAEYPSKFFDAHRDLLPADFTSSQVEVVLNCPDAVVEIRLVIDQIEAAAHPPKPVKCDEKEENKF